MGNLCYKHRAPVNGELPKTRTPDQVILCVRKGVVNVQVTNKIAGSIDPIVSPDPQPQTPKRGVFDNTDSYQKILDYHIVEILMTTVAFAVVILLRLHR